MMESVMAKQSPKRPRPVPEAFPEGKAQFFSELQMKELKGLNKRNAEQMAEQARRIAEQAQADVARATEEAKRAVKQANEALRDDDGRNQRTVWEKTLQANIRVLQKQRDVLQREMEKLGREIERIQQQHERIDEKMPRHGDFKEKEQKLKDGDDRPEKPGF